MPPPHCSDDDHDWTLPGQFAIIYCLRCGTHLSASFAVTQRQIAQLPIYQGGPNERLRADG